MVRNGPDSSDITLYAPTSRGWPYWPISAMYRPPLVSFIAATMASVEMPANTPALDRRLAEQPAEDHA